MSENSDRPFTRVSAVVIMAAGAGTRMKSATAKVLHRLGGRSMISYADAQAPCSTPEETFVSGVRRDRKVPGA